MSYYPQYFAVIAHNTEQPGPAFSRLLPIGPRAEGGPCASPTNLRNATLLLRLCV